MKIHSVALIVSFLAFPVCAFHPPVAQEAKERGIRRLPIERNEPIVITEIKVNGQPVSFDKKFLGNDDWVKGLVISVKNRSQKLILLASIDLQFPRPRGSEGLKAVHDIYYGNPALVMHPPSAEERLVGLAPGEVADVKMSMRQFDAIRYHLTQIGYPLSINKLDLKLGRIIFDDDTMWYAGVNLHRDPADPSTWVNVDSIGNKQGGYEALLTKAQLF